MRPAHIEEKQGSMLRVITLSFTATAVFRVELRRRSFVATADAIITQFKIIQSVVSPSRLIIAAVLFDVVL